MADLNISYTVDNLYKKVLDNHNIDINTLKKGDLQRIIHKPSGKEYFIILNKICYEFVTEIKDNKYSFKLVPAQDFLKKIMYTL